MPAGETAMQQVTDQIGHIREMLAKDSTNFDAWAALGNLYFDAGMPEDAIPAYHKALALEPSNPNVLTDMATMYRSIKRPDSAISILRQVIAFDSTWQQAWFNLGVIYNFDLKDQQSALVAWRRFLLLNPVSEQSTSVLQEIERIEAELGE
jgi:cytochrome c-type biogenesis protein CcmH/NrfG